MPKTKHFTPLDTRRTKFLSDGRDIPIGDEALVSKSETEEYIKTIFKDVTTTHLDIVPSCDCGKISGHFYRGAMCPECGTQVTNFNIDTLNYKFWIPIPKDLPPVLHPIAYTVMRDKWLGPLLDKILNSTLELPEKYYGKLGQGFKYFYENFDDIIKFLYQHEKKNNSNPDYVIKFINKYKNIFIVRARHKPKLTS
ncbi:MAG: hypothetical protein ACP6IS_12810 [Candidatus Asgardarchaeia archaeon]